MLKNLLLFRLEGDAPDLDATREAMRAYSFVPCGPTQPYATGWVPPRTDGEHLLERVGEHLIAKLMIETRSVPSQAVKKAVDERLDAIEKETGRRPRGKIVKELKEEALQALLPRAFPRSSAVLVWIDAKARILAVEATTHAKADLVLSRLVEVAPGMRVAMLQAAQSAGSCMAAWLTEQEPPSGFSIDRECELKQPDGEKAVVRYARHTLEGEEVGEHIRQGKYPTKVAMTWGGRVSFLLTDDLKLKRVEILDVVTAESDREEHADAFEADVAITTGELRTAIAGLIDALGGVMVPPVVEEAQAKPAVHLEGDGPDPLIDQARALVIEHKRASISLVQRHLRIGYNRAARLLEGLEKLGVVSPMYPDGNRTILTMES